MRASSTTALRGERGQTLVFFVVLLAGLIVVLALVVDVGAWLGTKRKLQTVADAAALAAVQSAPSAGSTGTAVNADDWATLTYDPPLDPAAPAPPDAVTVTATRAAPIILSGVAGIPAFDVKVTVTAQAQSATLLNNARLTQVTPADPARPSPYVVPLVVNECIFRQPCPAGVQPPACVGSTQPCALNLDALNRRGSLFGIANISGAVPDDSTFSNWVTCTSCAPGDMNAQMTAPPLTPGDPNKSLDAMNQVAAGFDAVGRTVITPVFDDFDGASYHIVGFAAFAVTTKQFDAATNWQFDANTCRPNCKVINGYFTDYTLPSSYGTGDSTAVDFGVRAIGLTS